MKLERSILILLAVAILFVNCSKTSEKRKIKLAQNERGETTLQTLSTTVRLEGRERRTLAVLFFQNLTGDANLQWLQKGLTEMFIRTLSQSNYLTVLTTERLLELFERLGKKDIPDKIEGDLAAVVAKEAQVEVLLTGQIVKNGEQLTIQVRLQQPPPGVVLQEESISGAGLENIFAMVDNLSQKIRNELQLTFDNASSQKGIADLTTNSLDAWRYYADGKALKDKLLYNEAIPDLEKAIQLDTTFVAAYLDLFSLYLSIGESEKAASLYEKFKKYRDTAAPQERYQIDLIDAKIKSDAVKYIATFNEWLEKYPDDRDAHYNLAQLYRSWNNDKQAIKYFENTIAIDPKYKLAYNQLGYAYAYIGNFVEAMGALKKYQELSPNEANPYDSMGEINFLFGKYEKAEDYFKQALKINKNFISSIRSLGLLKLYTGDYNKALAYFEHMLHQSQDKARRASAYYLIALTQLKLGNRDKAIENCQKTLLEKQFDFQTIDLIHQIYLSRGDSAQAKAFIETQYNSFLSKYNAGFLPMQMLNALCWISIWWRVNEHQSIALAEQTIADLIKSSDHAYKNSNLTDVKLMLTLLYIGAQEEQKIDKLWAEKEMLPTELWSMLKDVKNFSYSNQWQAFGLLNELYYDHYDEGLAVLKDFINFAYQNNAQPMEMMNRLLLADLYLHHGNKELAELEQKQAGVASEKTWKIIGPFEYDNGYHKKYPPEKEIKLGNLYSTKFGDIEWQPEADAKEDGFINFAEIFFPGYWSVAYGLVYVNSPEIKNVQFRFGSDDMGKIWLNDNEVWALHNEGPAIFDDNKIDVTLKEGLNKILVKVCNTVGDWGFFFRITDENGIGVPDIQFISFEAIS